MNSQKDPHAKEGMRIKLISMDDDPNPIPAGMKGTIILVDDMGVIHVNWDNGRRLGVVPGADEYMLEPDLENVFDKINEGMSSSAAIKSAIKKTSSSVNTSMPKPVKVSSSISSSLKSSGIKTGQVSKNFKSANIKDVKVESEQDLEETTGAGGAGGGTSSGPYVGPMGATKPTFGKGPLNKKTGVAKPGPLHPKNENIFTKNQLVKEITYMKDHQKLKKEDILRMVKNRLDEVKKGVTIDLEHGDEILTGRFKNRKEKVKSIGKNDKNQPTVNKKPMLKFKIPKLNPKEEIKKEENIEETTTFGSVFPGGNFPVVPAFAAKKGEWRTAKKPIWKGGKIVQQVENSGVLNPVNEANKVKYNPQGKIVKIKKKCTKFPYCSQGAVDNPLNISNKVTEPGTYVEQFYKNIHEVALETGKTFDEVYQMVKQRLNN